MKTALRTNLKWILPLLLVTAFVFSNSLNGEFVYDDKRQILRNPLIQNPEQFTKALTSDVWAFKGDGNLVASNYWRPTFTAWSILNYGVFGADPFGWHLFNVLLHLAVCLLCFQFLIRLGTGPPAAFVISLLFAVHPVHTESVAWIAGSPDLLFSFFFLLSLILFLRFLKDGKNSDFWASVVAFVPAIGAKEIGLLVIPVYFLLLQHSSEGSEKKNVSRSFGPFVAIGALYFIARWIVLGRLSESAPGAAGIESAFYTAPSVFIFYVKQAVFPFVLGPNYSLRPIEGITGEFLVALLATGAILACLLYLSKRSAIQTIGFSLFVLPLLPAFNIPAFIPEQIVHDRYLYLPVLGLLMVVVPEAGALLKKLSAEYGEKAGIAAGVLISIVLGIQTYSYNRVWLDEISLWRHSVTIDADSSFNFSQLGSILAENNKIDESLEAYNRSLDIKPTPLAYLGRARNFIAKGKFEESIWDLKTIAEMKGDELDAYTLYQTYEALAVAYQGKQEPHKAAEILRVANKRLPIYRAAFTNALGVVLYQQGKKEEALKELESVRDQARREMLPESKAVFFRLGLLYAEQKRDREAYDAFEEFLLLTNGVTTEEILRFRKIASDAIQNTR